MIEDEKESEGFTRPKPDYSKDKNVQARMRAGKRSANSKFGKDIEDGVAETEAPADGGIVAAAEEELAVVQDAVEENAETPAEENAETPADENKEAEEGIIDKEPIDGEAEAEKEAEKEGDETPMEGEETPAEEAPEGDTAIEQFAKEEASEPEHKDSGAIEQFAKEEASEPEHQAPVGEYQPPEGEDYDALIDMYHEALAFGDIAQAKELFHKIHEHQYQQNTHRAKSDAAAAKEAQEFVDAAKEIVAAHPELAEDGLPANKVLALQDLYRNEGMSAVEALRQAVADLYPSAKTEEPKAVEPAAVEEPAKPEETSEPAKAEESAAEEDAGEAPDQEADSLLPDMTDRTAQKRNIPAMPSASARNEPAPEPEKPTRSSAINAMKAKRGQM